MASNEGALNTLTWNIAGVHRQSRGLERELVLNRMGTAALKETWEIKSIEFIDYKMKAIKVKYCHPSRGLMIDIYLS